MQNDRKKLIRRAATAGGALVLAASFAAVTSGQDATSGHSMHHGHHTMGSDQAGKTDAKAAGCHEMMEAHQHMMSDLDAMNTTLDGLIAEMDSATGEKRIDVMAKVIHEMVAQRRQMAGNHPRMMAHMMSHMSGGEAGTKAAMAECPAMKSMMAASEGSEAGGHESHNH